MIRSKAPAHGAGRCVAGMHHGTRGRLRVLRYVLLFVYHRSTNFQSARTTTLSSLVPCSSSSSSSSSCSSSSPCLRALSCAHASIVAAHANRLAGDSKRLIGGFSTATFRGYMGNNRRHGTYLLSHISVTWQTNARSTPVQYSVYEARSASSWSLMGADHTSRSNRVAESDDDKSEDDERMRGRGNYNTHIVAISALAWWWCRVSAGRDHCVLSCGRCVWLKSNGCELYPCKRRGR